MDSAITSSFNACFRIVFGCLGAAFSIVCVQAASSPDTEWTGFTDKYCSSCHNDVDKEGGLDLTTLAFAPADAANFLTWVKIHDRVQNGEMPPKEKKRPAASEASAFVKQVSSSLVAHENTVSAQFGRVQRRRLNRSEYEDTLRDLFGLPALRVGDQLPEDGEAAHFNKVSKALDVSFVHVARYMSAAQTAIREAMVVELVKPPTKTTRYWARENQSFSAINGEPTRGRFPILGFGPDIPAVTRQAPLTVGDADPAVQEIEAMAWSHGDFTPAFQSNWMRFRVPVTGKYNLRFSGYTVWRGPGGALEPSRGRGGRGGFGGGAGQAAPGLVPLAADPAAAAPADPATSGRGGPQSARGGRGGAQVAQGGGGFPVRQAGPPEWYLGSYVDVKPGRRNEMIQVYAKAPPAPAKNIGDFDLTPEPQIFELKDIWLATNQYVALDATRFFRSRAGLTGIYSYTNPLSQPDGMPGVAFRWMEVEGPLYDGPVTPGYRLLFGDLPMKKITSTGPNGVRLEVASPPPPGGVYGNIQAILPKDPVLVEVESANPEQDAARLMQTFLERAYRRPVRPNDAQPFLALFKDRMNRGMGFAASMMAAYTGILASQEFVYLDEGSKGRLDDYALATRLSLLLTNGAPDAQLRAHAEKGDLRQPAVLRSETDRLLADPNSARFVQAFLDYWIDLRKVFETTPDMNLYGDYFLDDPLVDSAVLETQTFFTELLRQNMPARNIVDSDFAYINERLATHYGIAGVEGVKIRRVALPANSVRGGLMTQASVLKLTANGSTTSPVLRGKWIMERIVGYEIPPPPASVPAVEPDIRGATTIREQLDKHRADESCATCHRNIDPPGFALESFDILGGWRDRYRAVAKGQTPVVGFGKNGWPKTYFFALPVDPSGQTVDGRPFKDVRDFKQLLLKDEEQIARNLARQFVVYATGAPIRFSDRAAIEKILADTRSSNFGVRSILNAVIQSELFLNK